MAARIAVQGILLLVALAGARADEMIVEDEEASASTGDSGGDAPSGDSPSPPPMPDFDYEEMMRSMGGMGGGMGGMGGMDNPYMQKLRRENPGATHSYGGQYLLQMYCCMQSIVTTLLAVLLVTRLLCAGRYCAQSFGSS